MSLPAELFRADVNKKKPLRASERTAGTLLPSPLKGNAEPDSAELSGEEPGGVKLSVKGSLTLEAAIAVPLFVFFVMNLLFIFEAVRLQSGLQAAVQQAGEQVCEAAYYTRFAGSQGQDGGTGTGAPETDPSVTDAESGQAVSFLLSEVYVRGKVTSYLGEPFWRHNCVVGGRAGLSFAGSDIMSEGDRVEIVVSCRIRPFIRILGFKDFPMQARYCGHAWVGWTEGSESPADGGSGEGNEVYVTKYGECYHTDPGCIYLNPQIRMVPAQEVDKYRSGNGARYYPCETCRPGKSGTVYITKEGNRYHSDPSCGGIVRNIDTMDSTAAGGHYRPCPKCGKEH